MKIQVIVNTSFDDSRFERGDYAQIEEYVVVGGGGVMAIISGTNNIDALPLYALDIRKLPCIN